MGGLNSNHIFLMVLEAGKSNIKVLTDLVFGEGSLPGLQTDVFSLFLIWWRGDGWRGRGEGKQEACSLVSPCKGTHPID